jgi:hypothetical protein
MVLIDAKVSTYYDPADDVPQANNVGQLSATMDALAEGCTTGHSVAAALGLGPRQGDYYLKAARSLGLAVVVDYVAPYDWALTSRGAAYARATLEDRQAILIELLSNYTWLNSYTEPGGPEALQTLWRSEGTISGETINRRLQSLAAWATFYADTPASRLQDITSCTQSVLLRAPDIAQQIKKRRRRRESVSRKCPNQKCSQRRLEAPVAHTSCEECGTVFAVKDPFSGSGPEKALAKRLIQLGLEVDIDTTRLHISNAPSKACEDNRKNPSPDCYRCPDIVLPLQRIIIEFDGFYYHSDRAVEDLLQTLDYEVAGYQTIRVRHRSHETLSNLEVVYDDEYDTETIADGVYELVNSLAPTVLTA